MDEAKRMMRYPSVVFAACAGTAMIFLAGCTPEKARELRNAAAQFRADAGTAIQAVRDVMDEEIAAPPRSDSSRTDEFVKSILSLPKTAVLSSEIVELAIDPYVVQLSPQERSSRDTTLREVHDQYGAFSAIFDDLERGSFLAKDKVAKTKQYAVKLTAQMANLVKTFGDKPPRFIQRRAALVIEMDKVRKDSSLSAERQRQELSELKNSWDQLIAAEATTQQGVVGKCMHAAASGQAVLQMIDSYNKLSADDLGKLGESMLAIGEHVSGKNLTSLKAQNEKILGYLNANPEYRALLQPGLDRITTRADTGVSK